MVFIHEVAGIPDQIRVQTDPFCNGKSIGAARFSDNQLIQRLQVFLIKSHRSIHNSRGFVGHYFEIQVMRGHDAKRMFFHQFLQYDFRKCTTQIGITAAAQFIDKKQRASVGLLHEIFHVHQVGTVGAQLKFQALGIADMYHDLLKYTHR